ncbi:MAG: SnoaL-like domain-containing protein [Nonomuraea sp.]|nr:SnoaL-like domain-containing protein [Nonomuraea sp.]NUP64315.1 SnoaL-like domain-containing protein [Nonomuraea sp.]
MSQTPRQVVERVLQAGLAQDYETVIDLMAPDGHIEWPYRPAGVPARLEGRDRIRRYLSAAAKAPIVFDEFTDMVIYETDDPEVVIAEYEAHGRVTTTGAPYRQSIIAVFRVADGHIRSYRDYLNPLALLEARAALPDA